MYFWGDMGKFYQRYSLLRYMSIILLCLIACFAFAAENIASTAKLDKDGKITLGLREVIFLAVRNNPNIRSAEIDRMLQRFELDRAFREFTWRPSLSGNASYNKTSPGADWSKTYGLDTSASLKTHIGTDINVGVTNNFTDNGTTKAYDPELSLSITQPLLKGIGPSVTDASLENTIDQEKINKLSLKQSVISEVTTVINNYFDLEAAIMTEKNNLQNLKRVQETLRQTAINIKAGRNPPADLINAQSNVAQAKVTLAESIASVETQRKTLLQSIGFEDLGRIKISFDDGSLMGYDIPDSKKAESLVLNSNVSYQQSVLTVKQDKRKLLLARDALRWQLDAKYTTGLSKRAEMASLGTSGGFDPSHQFTFTLTVPLDDLDLKEALVTAEMNARNNLVSMQTARFNSLTNVDTTLRNLKTERERLNLTEDLVNQKKRNLDVVTKQRQFGTASAYDVSNAQQELQDAENSLVSSRTSYIKSVVGLQQTLGTTLEYWGIHLTYE